VLRWDLTFTTGLSAKNLIIYLLATFLGLRMVIGRSSVTAAGSMQGAYIVQIGYAIITWLVAALIIKYPNYELVASGIAMIVLLGGMRAVGVYVHVMIGLGLVMILIYGHLVASPLKRLRAAVAASDWPGAGAAMTMARRLVGINLVLGLVTITVAVLGRG